MDKNALIVHNFWTQASKLGICDHTTGLDELLDALVASNESEFIEAISRRGFEVVPLWSHPATE